MSVTWKKIFSFFNVDNVFVFKSQHLVLRYLKLVQRLAFKKVIVYNPVLIVSLECSYFGSRESMPVSHQSSHTSKEIFQYFNYLNIFRLPCFILT